MRIELSCRLPRSPDWVWERVQKSETLHYVAAPWVRFKPKAGRFPDRWTTGNHESTLWLLGVLPLGPQTISIEFPDDAAPMVLRDNGHGLMAKTWDHWIFVAADGGGTRYTDRVDVHAGVLTPFVALFARLFYAHRQRQWRALARAG